jgi:ferric-dicitrate binding protein FerR (iron transport regulator)
MFQRHRTATSRIVRMLRELEGADTAQDRSADPAKPASDRPRKRTAQQWFKATAVLIAAGSVAVIAWQARAVEMTEGATASTDVDHAPLQVIATP